MKRLFRYFELTKAEQRGFICLSIIFIITLGIPYVYSIFQNESPSIVHELHVFEKHSNKTVKNQNVSPKAKITMRVFNPNGLTVEEWQTLGISIQQAKVIKNYEAKGGQFRKKEDLQRIYSISEADYVRLAPYIRIERPNEVVHLNQINTLRSSTDTSYLKKKTETLAIELNKTDTVTLMLLRGIGPVLAKRIIKYRDALGGFVHVDQLKEVYGLLPETYSNIKDKLYIDRSTVVRLSINSLPIEELAKHPYITRKQAQWIVNYRVQHGLYESIESLTAINMLEQDFLRKIEPYLEF